MSGSKLFLVSVVFVPVLLGMLAGRSRRLKPGLLRLVLMVLTFDLAYMALLYYLRYRWS